MKFRVNIVNVCKLYADVWPSVVEAQAKLILLAMCLFLLSYKVGAITINKDSLKSKYDLNDPRNPNCPCHKHQKLADEEYRNWLKERSRITGIAISKLDVRKDKVKSGSEFSFMKIRAKRKTKSHPLFKKIFDFKRYGFLKRVTDTDACFKWKK